MFANQILLVKETYNKWSDHQAPRLGASVAFYSLLSFAPLLVLVTAVIALVFGQRSAQGALIDEARQLIGQRGAETVESLLKNAQKPSSGAFASVAAFITLLFGASGVFIELQDTLNLMWDAKPQTASGVLGIVKQRLFSFGMILSVGFLLLVSMLISAGLAYVGRSFSHMLPVPPMVLEAINFLVSFAVITALFALMFKYVPAAEISWRDVGVGAIGTALLFTIGKFMLGLYLGKASVGSTYGAAGSLVAVIVWIYYSAQIFFFGAEFTRVYAEAHGKRIGTEQSAPTTAEARPAAAQSTQPATPPKTAGTTVGASAIAASSLPRPSTTLIAPTLHQVRGLASGRSVMDNSPQTKPRLLMAAAFGFLLGRVFAAAKASRRTGSKFKLVQ
ncbi:MAG: YihY/virulence factor BrkB family protein [Acidobacteriaceae bacterium]|nr:YihY/virulence factor BrkB family protein [Acidobacteriaceae bacterium]MBV9779408.1 YihY/virulence factor BrkB family protein [Acidobacteriaceae bacterium]